MGIRVKKGKKLVRINSKTMIEVSVDIPDEVARAKYLKNLKERNGTIGSPGRKRQP